MEYFGARKGTPLSECLRSVRSADIVVLVLGMRYGSKDRYDVSITQREYERALAENKNILVYLMDEDKHPVLPSSIDYGDDAERLARFKQTLLDRHVCDFFVSPNDLATKVVVDLFRDLDLPDGEKMKAQAALDTELPGLVAAGGYSVGLMREELNLSNILTKTDNGIVLASSQLNDLLYSGYIALSLAEGNFNVLRGTLTFDGNVWDLLHHLCQHYKISYSALSVAIAGAYDVLHLRILISLAGRLRCEHSVDAICNQYVNHPNLEKEMVEYGAAPYTIRDVVKYALGRMPARVKPTVEHYLKVAKSRKHWQAKRTLEGCIRSLNEADNT